MTSRNIKIAGSFLFAVIVAGILVYVLKATNDRLAWLSCALGLSIGWGAGILATPYQSEKSVFKEYSRLLAAFVTGFIVSKADRIFELWIDRSKEHGFEEQPWSRLMIGLAAFVLALVTTYVARKYVSFGPGAENPPTAG